MVAPFSQWNRLFDDFPKIKQTECEPVNFQNNQKKLNKIPESRSLRIPLFRFIWINYGRKGKIFAKLEYHTSNEWNVENSAWRTFGIILAFRDLLSLLRKIPHSSYRRRLPNVCPPTALYPCTRFLNALFTHFVHSKHRWLDTPLVTQSFH